MAMMLAMDDHEQLEIQFNEKLSLGKVFNKESGSRNSITYSSENRKSFLKGIERMLKSQSFFDCIIQLKCNSNKQVKQILAHRVILSASSVILNQMILEEESKVSKQYKDEKLVVSIDCSNIWIMESLVNFMYSGVMELSDGIVLDVLMVAKKYVVEDLELLCHEHIGKQISLETVLPFLVQAHEQNSKFLISKCVSFVQVHMRELLDSNIQQLLKLPKRVLIDLLQSDFQGVEETELFDLVKKWGLARIQDFKDKYPDQQLPSLKDVLSGVVECIRFVSLSKKFLQKEVMGNDLISYDMMIQILFQKAKDPTHLNDNSSSANDDMGEESLPLYLRPRSRKWKTMDDFPSEEAYASYLKSVLTRGMRMRAVHTYEHVLEGDTGEFVQWNTGFPPCQIRWNGYGSVYWLHWRDVAICE
jgi:hypothetical protein